LLPAALHSVGSGIREFVRAGGVVSAAAKASAAEAAVSEEAASEEAAAAL